ncbi:F-box/FBD/LRR-repeat protein At1g13570-like [Lycium barbarum]|uniref:F-box/FBD/LRR-repeat protein At1g13570-like n=1 Tax=Lycium barbarum TaxID=112863 RepID=UPI00293EAE8D|nr:F-box/FBD/LRR-repeat protein At1g13570-like [Lycium barbarum]
MQISIGNYCFKMSPSGQKRACRSVPLDILSILPDKAIDNILMRLPLREAVRTSILAKTWRYIRCRLPQLELDESLWNLSQSSDPTPRFKDIVYHLLTLHEGPVTKFTLSTPNLKNYPKIDNLIYFLSRNDIQHLSLELQVRADKYKLPSSIFTCLQLRNLTLQNCLMSLPPQSFKGFDKLISLALSYVKIPSKFLKSLISSCPLLDKLVLGISESSCVTEINAPMLKYFDFTGDISCICLKTIPRLSKLSLRCCEYRERSGKFDIAKFFELFVVLTISTWITIVSR